jgi:lon-related putative ATP-dependent protease
MTVKPLIVEALCTCCNPESLAFATTEELEDLNEVLGQARALEALQFGVGMNRKGYNLYAMGPPGVGKHAIVRRVLSRCAVHQTPPSDWVYVNNFAQPHQPLALEMPAGRGETLRRDMEQLLEDLKDAIPAAFDSDDYRNQVRQIEMEFKRRHEEQFRELQQKARSLGIALLSTPTGFALAPMKDGKVLGPDEFEKLPDADKKHIERVVAKLQEDLQQIAQQMPRWRREHRERIRALNHEVALAAVGHIMEELRRSYTDLPKVYEYLKAVQQDVLDNVDDFLSKEEEGGGQPLRMMGESPSLRRYQVNVLVSHKNDGGAPIVYEDNPTFQNLIGRVEYMSQFGTLVTDFTLIKPGALHRANGGYLLVDVLHLFSQPFAWEGLKRALFSQEVRIVSLGEMVSLLSTVSLEPQSIPLKIKIVMLGERLFYYLLYQLDPDFRELFKVAADLEEEVERSDEHNHVYARLLATLIRKESLRPFACHAVARVIEHSARLAEDAEKLSIHMQTITDLLQEADYWAGQENGQTVQAEHVQRAIEAQRYRSRRVHEKLLEAIRRNIMLIDTSGAKVGQINGLSVLDLGDSRWGQPARITATVRLGSGQVVDIEREVELGGAIHSKGVLILSSFLGSRYAGRYPLSLHASLVFEQSYGKVEGDSASLAELCALLSALADTPIQQSFAVTGSVNQHGQVQAIGGVNEKIEGFFDVCRERGGPDGQAVIIPVANVKHLMLREEIVQAVAEKRFAVYAVSTVDEALELLAGLPAGERDAQGTYPEGSLNQRVEARLIEFSKSRQAFAKEASQALEETKGKVPAVPPEGRLPPVDKPQED